MPSGEPTPSSGTIASSGRSRTAPVANTAAITPSGVPPESSIRLPRTA